MKKVVSFLIFSIIIFQAIASEIDLRNLMRRSQAFDRGAPVSATIQVQITDKKGDIKEMNYDMYTARDESEIHVMIDFFAPHSYNGTRILTKVPISGGEPKVNVKLKSFLPIINVSKVDYDMPFFGMDFASGDMSPRDSNLDEYTLLSIEKLEDGSTCYVVEGHPLDGNFYYKTIHYIDIDKELIVKSEMYDKKNTLVKIFEVLEVDKIQGLWTPTKTKMTSTKEQTHTELSFKNIAYGKDNSSYITSTYLKTGTIN